MATDPKSTNPPDAAAAAQPAGESAPTAVDADAVGSQLQKLQSERDMYYQNWLRTQADLENYRKRVQKEIEQERQYSLMPLVRDLLPPLDNLDRTLQAASQSNDLAKLIQGVQMVAKQFESLLSKNKIERIEAVGKPFDPNLHQAMQQIPTADHPPMTVLQEYERGYTLHDRVVRPSTVVVAAPPSA